MTSPQPRYAKPLLRSPDGQCTPIDCWDEAMLYGAGVPDEQMMKKAPHVGIASVWWEGNPCK